DLTLSMSERGGRLVGACEYAADLFDASTIERMNGHFRTLLESASASTDTRLRQLAMLSEAERLQQLIWAETRSPYPRDGCIHRLFEEQATGRPDALA